MKAAESPPENFSPIGHWARTWRGSPSKEFSLSISQIEAYGECPLKYQYSFLWRIPVAPTPALEFGFVLHGAVKDLVEAVAHRPGTLTAERVEAILRDRWQEASFSDPVQKQKYWELGCRQLRELWQELSAQPFELLHQEKKFEIDQGGIRLVGRIDQINRVAERQVELIEYKTGRPQTQQEADRSLQLTLYARACREVLGLEPAALILYNLTTQEALQTRRGPEDFLQLEAEIRDAHGGIQTGEFPARRGYHCRYCAYRAICPAQEESFREAAGAQEPGTTDPQRKWDRGPIASLRGIKENQSAKRRAP